MPEPRQVRPHTPGPSAAAVPLDEAGEALKFAERALCRLSAFAEVSDAAASQPIATAGADWPQTCRMCGHAMTSADDRIQWHGIGNCVDECATCGGSGEVEVSQTRSAKCVNCDGWGYRRPPLASRPSPDASPEAHR